MSKKDDAYANTLATPLPGEETAQETVPLTPSAARAKRSTQPEPSGASESDDAWIGEKLGGRYEVTGRAGAGGFGVVYKATDLRLQKTVAIKVLSEDPSRNHQLVERFRGEALAVGKLNHPNIVGATDFDVSDDGRPYLVMEFVKGATLDEIMREAGKLDVKRAARLARGLCSALAAAHDAGIIHRDLKPANIMVQAGADGSETPKVLDFGVAKLVQKHKTPSLTNTGQMLGTPIYMAPEQIRSRAPLDGRADLYAVGVILYEMITAATPFSSEGAGDVMVSKMVDKPIKPSKHAPLPGGFERLILKAIARDRKHRFETPAEMAAALEPYTADTGLSSQTLSLPAMGNPMWRMVAIAALVLGVGITGYVVLSGDDEPPGTSPSAAPGAVGPTVEGGDPNTETAPDTEDPAPDTEAPESSAGAGTQPEPENSAPKAPDAAPAAASVPDAGAKQPEADAAAETKRVKKKRRRKAPKRKGGFYDSPNNRLRVPK